MEVGGGVVSPQKGGELRGRVMQKENIDVVFSPNIDRSE